MTNLNAKLIVSDFDGTLTNSDGRVTDEIKNAILQYVSDGGIFAVCTGRMLASILPRVREIGLKGVVVACQGTVIADIQSGKIIKCVGLKSQEAAEICKVLEDNGDHVNAYSGSRLISGLPAENYGLKAYEAVTGITAEHVGIPISEYILKNNLICQKITSLCAPQDKLHIYKYLLDKFDGRFDLTYSADVLVEIAPLGEDKGNALKFLAQYYNVPIEDTVAVGDHLNDLSMIRAAGVGVAVGNATQALKEQADYITVSNNDGAVAKVIKKFGYRA